MSENLPQNIQQSIRAYCRSLAPSKRKGNDLAEELATHLEEKIFRYLDGTEPLTPDDAFLLAREHFGNSGEIRDLLRQAYKPSLLRVWVRIVLGMLAAILLIPALMAPLAVIVVPVLFPVVIVLTLVTFLGYWVAAPATVMGLLILVNAVRPSRLTRKLALATSGVCMAGALTLFALFFDGGIRWLTPGLLAMTSLMAFGSVKATPRAFVRV